MKDGLHENEIAIDDNLVRRLVDEQFPAYADLSLNKLDVSGSTNVQFRLGDQLLVRLPRQPGGGGTIEKERRWLPAMGELLPVAVPEIIAVGEADFRYAEQWSIVRWLDGNLARACQQQDNSHFARLDLASDLADIVHRLRAAAVPEIATADRHLRQYRGASLAAYDDVTRRNIEKCKAIKELELDMDAALSVWEDALDLPGAHEVAPDRWYHGDLVAENLLLNKGRLSGVLDFGGLGIGDPTIDLHGAWELFDPQAREYFRTRLNVDEAEWLRGRAWALAIALSTFTYYWTTMPGRIRDRMAMAKAVLDEASAHLN